MPSVSIHLFDHQERQLATLQTHYSNVTSRPLSRSATIRRAVEQAAAARALTTATDDELSREIGELDTLIESAHQRRARLVTAVCIRDRQHRSQTRITDPQPQETRQ